MQEYFRPNFWPNTPDIFTEYLQFGGRPAFIIRLVLAATLGANYGIYGPAYELLREHTSIARQRGISELGEVRGQALGLELVLESEGFHCPRQPDPEREPRAPQRLGSAFPPYRQSDADLL